MTTTLDIRSRVPAGVLSNFYTPSAGRVRRGPQTGLGGQTISNCTVLAPERHVSLFAAPPPMTAGVIGEVSPQCLLFRLTPPPLRPKTSFSHTKSLRFRVAHAVALFREAIGMPTDADARRQFRLQHRCGVEDHCELHFRLAAQTLLSILLFHPPYQAPYPI